MNQFLPFPNLETERLTLRRVTAADTDAVFIMRSDPDVMRYIPRPMAETKEDALAVINMVEDFLEKNEKINWAIEWKESKQMVGMIGYVNLKPDHARAEIRYSLARTWHRKGIMYEALLCVMKYGFEQMQLHSIEAIIDAENVASGKLLEAAGFRQEAHFIEDFCFKGVYRNSIHYGMLCSEGKEKGIC